MLRICVIQSHFTYRQDTKRVRRMHCLCLRPPQVTLETKGVVEWVSVGFFHAFVAAFSVIIVSEMGDKTFFIAAIMAMKHSR